MPSDMTSTFHPSTEKSVKTILTFPMHLFFHKNLLPNLCSFYTSYIPSLLPRELENKSLKPNSQGCRAIWK